MDTCILKSQLCGAFLIINKLRKLSKPSLIQNILQGIAFYFEVILKHYSAWSMFTVAMFLPFQSTEHETNIYKQNAAMLIY